MININLGVIVLLITILGYISNMLNWRYLNYEFVRILYYIGALVHEASHAILCVLTGAKIEEFTVFAEQPRVVHQKSRIPFVGEVLISFAPLAGGLLFLFLINKYALGNYFVIPALANAFDWKMIGMEALSLVAQIDFFQWQSWVMIFLFFNVGAMLGPSFQDLKNVWPMLILLFFVPLPWVAGFGALALSLIAVNIILQLVMIFLLKIVRFGKK